MFRNTESLSNIEVNLIWKSLNKHVKSTKTKQQTENLQKLVHMSQNLRMLKRRKKNKEFIEPTTNDIMELDRDDLEKFFSVNSKLLTNTRSIKTKKQQINKVFQNIEIIANFLKEEIL